MLDNIPNTNPSVTPTLPLNVIAIKEGFNPRSFFDEDAMKSLVASVKEAGIIQPIAVRPNEDDAGHYWIIAGERRFRAASEANLQEVPVAIHHVDEKTALMMAMVENCQRDDMSRTEEAEAARKLVDLSGGDREEAAKQLGISRQVLDGRLLLLNCSDKVKQLLNERQIKIGHAELLAQLPTETQDATVDKVLSDKVSVKDLKKKLSSYAQALENACFDVTDCNQCPHNSTTQASLFDVHVGSGKCANRECWQEKTVNHLKEKQADLANSTYPHVWLDIEKDPSQFTVLVKTGKDGVGEEQFGACKGCDNFGAILCSKAGEEGEVIEDVCTNLTCHKKKVKAYTGANDTSQSGRNANKSSGRKTATGVTANTVKKATNASSNAVPRKVTEHINKCHREIAAKQLANNQHLIFSMALLGLKKLATEGGVVNAALKDINISSSDQSAGVIKKAMKQDAGKVAEKIRDVACAIIKDDNATSDMSDFLDIARTILAHTETKAEDHFVIDKAFLQTMTKSGIESVLSEKQVGFNKWYDEKEGKGAFSKLMKAKNDILIDTVLGSGFDFTGKVPRIAAFKKAK